MIHLISRRHARVTPVRVDQGLPRRFGAVLMAAMTLSLTLVAGTGATPPAARGVIPPPNITGFHPVSGVANSFISIYGTNFIGTTAVTFAGLPAQFTTHSDNLLVAKVPNSLSPIHDNLLVSIGVQSVLYGTSDSTGNAFRFLGPLLCGSNQHGTLFQPTGERPLLAVDDSYSRDQLDPTENNFVNKSPPKYLGAQRDGLGSFNLSTNPGQVLAWDRMGTWDTAAFDWTDPATGPYIAFQTPHTRWYAHLFTGPSHAASFNFSSDGSFNYVPVDGYLGSDSFQYVFSEGALGACSNIGTVTIEAVRQLRPQEDFYTALRNQALAVGKFCCGLMFNDLKVSLGGPDGTGHVTAFNVPGAATRVERVDLGNIGAGDSFRLYYVTPFAITNYLFHSDDMSSAIFSALSPIMGTNLLSVRKEPDSTGKYLLTTNGPTTPLVTISEASGFTPGSVTALAATRTYHGTLTDASGDSFIYIPDTDFTGPDRMDFQTSNNTTFTYSALNSTSINAGFQPVSVNISVFDPTIVPRPDYYAIVEDSGPLTILASTLLSNDQNAPYVTCVEGDFFTCHPATVRTQHGTLSLAWTEIIPGTGGFYKKLVSGTYTPDTNFSGTDGFTYFDGTCTGLSCPSNLDNKGIVSIFVSSVNDPPVAQDDLVVVNPNQPTIIDVAANDTDPDGDLDPSSTTLGICFTGCLPNNGTWTLNGDGTVTYTPTPGFSGSGHKHYLIDDDDPSTASDIGNITARVRTAADDAYEMTEDTTLIVQAPQGLLSNDAAPEATLISAPAHGYALVNLDGWFSYVPDPDFVGTDTFQYQATGGVDPAPAPYDVATVTITVVDDYRPDMCATAPFSDVPTTHPFCPEIWWVDDTDIANGFADGTYKPGNAVTRQAMAAFLARLRGASLPVCGIAPFTDVPTTHPFCREIQWMKEDGITTGFADGTYRPGAIVTRQAMSAFLARVAQVTPAACTSAPFSDVSIGHPFCKEINWMKITGISTGFSNGTFAPDATVTRQAMAAFLYRANGVMNTDN